MSETEITIKLRNGMSAAVILATLSGVLTYLVKVAEMIGDKNSDRDLHSIYKMHIKFVLINMILGYFSKKNDIDRFVDVFGFPLAYTSTTSVFYFFFQFLANRRIV